MQGDAGKVCRSRVLLRGEVEYCFACLQKHDVLGDVCGSTVFLG